MRKEPGMTREDRGRLSAAIHDVSYSYKGPLMRERPLVLPGGRQLSSRRSLNNLSPAGGN